MIFKRIDKYHAASDCQQYTIARFYAGHESTYMSWRGREVVARHTFAHEYGDDGRELPSYPARVEAYKAAVAACESDKAARRGE